MAGLKAKNLPLISVEDLKPLEAPLTSRNGPIKANHDLVGNASVLPKKKTVMPLPLPPSENYNSAGHRTERGSIAQKIKASRSVANIHP